MELKRDFSMSDLKDGMIVETRRGTLLLVVNNTLVNNENWLSLGHYNKDLTRYEWMKDNFRDIMKVYVTKEHQTLNEMFQNKKLIWERLDCREMTIEEVEEKLGYKVKIIDKKENNQTRS